MESCMRSLPLAFGDFSSACESDLDRMYSCEPKKGLCILLLISLSWGGGSTTSTDGPSYWTTSADSHLWDWRTVASGVGMAILRLEDKGEGVILLEGDILLEIWPLTALATWGG